MLNDATGLKKIYLAAGYTDLRRGIDGLATMIRFRFQLDPYDKNTLFLFCGKKTNRIKIFHKDQRAPVGRRWFPASLQEIRQWCVQLAALCGRSSGNIIRTVCDVHARAGDHTEASNQTKR